MISSAWKLKVDVTPAKEVTSALGEAAAAAAGARRLGRGLSFSYAGYCARRLGYQWANWGAGKEGRPVPFVAEPLAGRIVLMFQLGDLVEAEVKRWLAASGLGERFLPLSVEQQSRLRIVVAGQEVVGYADGLWQEGDGRLSILSIKSINERGYARVASEGPSYQNVCQVTAEMYALGLQSARIVYYNKNTSHAENEWLVPFSASLWEEIEERFGRVALSSVGDLPGREHEAEPEKEWVRGKPGEGEAVLERKSNGYWRLTGRAILPWECGTCPFKGECWGVGDPEFDGNKPVWVVWRRSDGGSRNGSIDLRSS